MPAHRHLLLRGLGQSSSEFEPLLGRGPNYEIPYVENRSAHALKLSADLREIADQLANAKDEQALAGIMSKKGGVTVAAASRAGARLNVGESRRSNSPGYQLLSVRRDRRGERKDKRDKAILFLTEQALERLQVQLDNYASYLDPEDRLLDLANSTPGADQGRPSNFWFFESLETFKRAGIEDLWNGSPEFYPQGKGSAEWEIWVRSSMVLPFYAAAEQLNIVLTSQATTFVDIAIFNIVTTKAALNTLITRSAAVVELRAASNFIAEHLDLPPPDRIRQMQGIASRVRPAPDAAPWVCLLDTGVNRDHPLLSPALPTARCRTVNRAWNPFDSNGHGSKMAGVALYGDLAIAAGTSGELALEVGLESVTVFDPTSSTKIPGRTAISTAVLEAEAASDHRRVFCLAATAVGEAEDGSPTPSSGTMDALAFNDGVNTRLFCVAVGNVAATSTEPYQLDSYSGRNREHGIQSPAQALNVLSVGALTNKCSAPSPVAGAGDLSPRSRTAQPWSAKHCKPDIVMEGGNHGIDPNRLTSRPHGPDMIATTSNNPQQITLTGDTSAACAAAAGLAGRLLARYPAMRAETVRGLLAHCADWTPAMLARHTALRQSGYSTELANMALLDCYGWGVPDEERVFWSADNALTLIAEDHIQPYKHVKGASVTLKEMKSFHLPWPDRALAALGGQDVEMRCTLSFFIEPDLHSANLDRPQQYPSHRLQFDFQRYEESEAKARSRVNRAVSTDDPASDDDGWLLKGGPTGRRARGTLHQDIWRGPAYQLVGRRMINVTPVRGWWANSPKYSAADRSVPFSLIVSIRTPATELDLMSEVRSQVPAHLLADLPSLIST